MRFLVKCLFIIIVLTLTASISLCSEQWEPFSLAGQTVHTLLIDPQRPENMYALVGIGNKNAWTFGSDILKTTDGGNRWQSILRQILKPSCIAIDPTRPNIIYVSGEKVNKFGVPNAAVFKSTDGGKQWNEGFVVHSDIEGWIYQMKISPADPDVLYVALQRLGQILFQSADGGETWTPRWSGGPFLIYPDSADSNTLYILTSDLGPGRFAVGTSLGESTDGGMTFDRLELSDIPFDEGVDSLAITPDHPDTFYVSARHRSENWVLKSADAGLTWEAIATKLDPKWYDFRVLYINPANPNVVYGDINRICAPPCAWSSQLLISENGGRNWRPFMDGMASTDFSQMTFHPTRPEEIYACTKNGIYMISYRAAIMTDELPDRAKKTTWGNIRSEL